MNGAGTLLIVGAGLAGAKAAEAARTRGYDGRILLVGEEPALPYERPPLSKAILRGEAGPGSPRVHDAGYYSDHDIDLITDDAVQGLDLRLRRANLASGTTVAFDAVILATGAAPRRLQIPGAELGDIHYLRTIDNCLGLRHRILQAGRVAVIGAGWIGSEVAASARQMGADVLLIDPLPAPLQRVLGPEVGAVFGQLHADHKVQLRLGVGVTELRGGRNVEQVVLSDGRVEDADVVIAGIGVTPRVELAVAAGLPVDNGIVVDANLQTSALGVFAAGDVANAWHPYYRRHLRVEHWANALHQGAAAGANAISEPAPYDRLPYFFSDQYDLGLEYVGYADTPAQVVIRGDLDSRQFIAFYHRDGVVTAAMNVNVWDVGDELRTLVTAPTRLHLEHLADPEVSLRELAAGKP